MADTRAEISARYYRKNKEKCVAIRKAWRDANPDQQRAINARAYQKHKPTQIKYRYGISEEQYTALMSSPCGICGKTATCVDHDHDSGHVRGGLCVKCNSGLGMFADNPLLLQMAMDYLTKSRA